MHINGILFAIIIGTITVAALAALALCSGDAALVLQPLVLAIVEEACAASQADDNPNENGSR